MSKFISIAEFPVLIISGILGQKLAAKLWSQVLGSDPPDTAQPNVHVPQLIAAGIVEGALYKFARMGVDRGLRTAVYKSTGAWPGRQGEGE